MEIFLGSLDRCSDYYDVKEALAKELHSSDLSPLRPKRLLNFEVFLNKSEVPGFSNDGTGSLIVPDREIGVRLLQKVKKREIKVLLNGRRIEFTEADQRPKNRTVEILRKVPYQDPSIDRLREEKIEKLSRNLRIDKLQFGCWIRRPFQERPDGIFAVEWPRPQRTRVNEQGFYASLQFDYIHKAIRIQLGDPLFDHVKNHFVVKFSNIREIWVGCDFGNFFVCFDLITPSILEREWLNRVQTGNARKDQSKFRQRIGAVPGDHGDHPLIADYAQSIAQYAHHIRITLFEDTDLQDFFRLCGVAGVRTPKRAQIDAGSYEYFSSKRLDHIRRLIERLPWSVAFQVEALLLNGIVDTETLQSNLLGLITKFAEERPEVAGGLLVHFVQALAQKPVEQSVSDYFKQCVERRIDTLGITDTSSDSYMLCHHITITPTRMKLEGPYPIQSNRVLRRYRKFHEHFVRVSFRDEDRLQYRWDREVDGTKFLQDRVGGILKDGFVLAGRRFEFLAYSSSALREHSVWFLNPFEHPYEGFVTATEIRKGLGDFSGVLTYPAKFAARLSQAFTATAPSVRITREQWTIIPDIGEEPYLFTEGVGTISSGLGHLIYEALCKDKPRLETELEPYVYQIRFQGFKGVVRIDPQLTGIRMHLRPSMRKFIVNEDAGGEIEIAQAFHGPGKMFLNRPLITLLEDRGVNKETFLNLQKEAVLTARLARTSIHKFSSLLKSNTLGSKFALPSILEKLSALGLEFNHEYSDRRLNYPFLSRLVESGIMSILRDIKYRARIQVPQGCSLVGVADEGPAYIKQGFQPAQVFTLKEGEIFACIQLDSESDPIYLEGDCMISRSPTIHPGDAQKVRAVGKPPQNKVCSFKHLRNCVVLPSVGRRSLASCLSGGDLDGDLYEVCLDPKLLVRRYHPPADYPPVQKKTISEKQIRDPVTRRLDPERVIPYVRDFVVEYINSDVLGLLSDFLLVRADQSSYGFLDYGCLELSKLCSQAVDYPKNGMAVDIGKAPKRLIPYKPDWKENEVDGPRKTDFYRSERALGYLFRAVDLAAKVTPKDVDCCEMVSLEEHPIYKVLWEIIELKSIGGMRISEESVSVKIGQIFREYVYELRFIASTHTLTDHLDATLTEEEIVLGTILSHCSQHKWRQERIYAMRLHSRNLITQVKAAFYPTRKYSPTASESDSKYALQVAWAAWKFTVEQLARCGDQDSFGLNSFGLVALQTVFECLAVLK